MINIGGVAISSQRRGITPKGLGGQRNASWGFLGDMLADHVKNKGKGNSATAHNRDLNVWMPGQY